MIDEDGNIQIGAHALHQTTTGCESQQMGYPDGVPACGTCERFTGEPTNKCMFPETSRKLEDGAASKFCKFHPKHYEHKFIKSNDDLIHQLQHIQISGKDTYAKIESMKQILISLCERTNK